jgi:hypothetical protein
MLELLVVISCVGNYRCDQASKAYFTYNPVPKVWAEKKADKVEKAMGKQAAVGLITIAAFATQKSYQIKITNHWSIGKFEDTAPEQRTPLVYLNPQIDRTNTYSVPGVMYGFNF